MLFLFCFRVEDITVFLCAACNDLVDVDADDTGKRRTIARGMPSSRQEGRSFQRCAGAGRKHSLY